MFYRTTMSIYRIAPEDKSWLYAGSSNVSANTVASVSLHDEEKAGSTSEEEGRVPTSSSSGSSDCTLATAPTDPAPNTKDHAKLSRLASSSSSTLPQVQGTWTAPFTDCFGKSTPDVAYACPPIMYARLSKRLRGGSMATACITYSLFGACCACSMAAPLRSQLRRKYALPMEPCSDGFTHLFCSPCAVWQEYREVETREGAWNADKPAQPPQHPQVHRLSLNQQQLKQQQGQPKADLDSARFKDVTDDSTKPRPSPTNS